MGALSLYAHIPFCEMRCGFCNLFTRSTPPAEQVRAYLEALRREAEATASCLPPQASFARAALGGGTPTYLTADELGAVYDLLEKTMGVDLTAIPMSVETSPATATPDRLAVLAERGATRISMGVQSFIDSEAHAAGRPQKRPEVDRALSDIRSETRADLNVDLIYGIERQTADTWRYSLDTAVSWRPEEIYLYPLYVRPLTGLGRGTRSWDDHRLTLYRQGRDYLREHGYEQVSMRMFRGRRRRTTGPDHCCQTDGMVGLGCGARSYTSGTHYSFDYAVGVGRVRSIIEDYVGRDAGDFARAEVGFHLDEEERRRRHVLQSLLGWRAWTHGPTPNGSAPTRWRIWPRSSARWPRAGGWSPGRTPSGPRRSGSPRRGWPTPTRSPGPVLGSGEPAHGRVRGGVRPVRPTPPYRSRPRPWGHPRTPICPPT